MKKIYFVLVTFLLVFLLSIKSYAYYVAIEGNGIYHYPNCEYGSMIADYHKVTFSTAQDAVRCGYRPCHVCWPPTSDPYIYQLRVDEPKVLDLSQSKGISYTYWPANAIDSNNVTASIENTDIAYILNGNVYPKNVGTTRIILTSSTGVTAYGSLTVKEVPVTSLTINNDIVVLGKGDSHKIQFSILPYIASEKNKIYFKSTNEEVATVDQSGIISAKSIGRTTISVTCNGVSDSFVLEVTPIKVTDIKNELIRYIYLNTERNIEASVYPPNATYPEITYSSGSPDVISIDKNGNIKGLKEGQSLITLKTRDYEKSLVYKCEINKVNDIKIDGRNKIYIGEERSLNAIVSPSDATYPDITYFTSDSNIINITEDGKIKGMNKGRCDITLKTNDYEKVFRFLCRDKMIERITWIVATFILLMVCLLVVLLNKYFNKKPTSVKQNDNQNKFVETILPYIITIIILFVSIVLYKFEHNIKEETLDDEVKENVEDVNNDLEIIEPVEKNDESKEIVKTNNPYINLSGGKVSEKNGVYNYLTIIPTTDVIYITPNNSAGFILIGENPDVHIKGQAEVDGNIYYGQEIYHIPGRQQLNIKVVLSMPGEHTANVTFTDELGGKIEKTYTIVVLDPNDTNTNLESVKN